MTHFRYKAANSSGKISQGSLEADSPERARAVLRTKGLLPIALKLRELPVEESETSGSIRAWLHRLRPPLDGKALALITRQLSTLLANDVQIETALSIAAAQARHPRTRAVLQQIRRDVIEGKSLASSLRQTSGAFSDQYIASVAAGEETGQLDQVMGHLADYVEAEQGNRQTVQLALVYPAFLALISGAIITMLMTNVVPDIVSVYQRRGTDLPASTDILIAISSLLRNYGLVALLAIFAVIMAYQRSLRRHSVRLKRDRIMTRLPLASTFTRKRNAAEFSGTLSILVQSGVPLVKAMQIATGVVRNTHIRAQITAASEAVREGASLETALSVADTLPPMLLAMVASGTQSGDLGASLARSASDQRSELDAEIKTLVALIEPLVLVLMGGIVLLIVMAIITPIVNMNSLTGV